MKIFLLKRSLYLYLECKSYLFMRLIAIITVFAGVVLQPAGQVAPRGEAPQPEASGRQQQRRAAAAGVGRVRGGVQHGLARHARPRPHAWPRPRRLQAALQHRDLQLHVSLHTPAQLHGGCLQVDAQPDPESNLISQTIASCQYYFWPLQI